MMRRMAGRTAAVVVLCALVWALALAKNESHTISFNQDLMVNGTLVKQGEYQATFDEKTGEFSLHKGRHVIVTANGKEEPLGKKAPATSFDMKAADNNEVLTKITFEGDRYAIILGDNQNAQGQ